MLERYAVKVARTVLRGGSGSNATSLPDQVTVGFAPLKELILCLNIFHQISFVSSRPPAGNANR